MKEDNYRSPDRVAAKDGIVERVQRALGMFTAKRVPKKQTPEPRQPKPLRNLAGDHVGAKALTASATPKKSQVDFGLPPDTEARRAFIAAHTNDIDFTDQLKEYDKRISIREDLSSRVNNSITAAGEDPDHPRWPAGSPVGGRFRPKTGGAGKGGGRSEGDVPDSGPGRVKGRRTSQPEDLDATVKPPKVGPNNPDSKGRLAPGTGVRKLKEGDKDLGPDDPGYRIDDSVLPPGYRSVRDQVTRTDDGPTLPSKETVRSTNIEGHDPAYREHLGPYDDKGQPWPGTKPFLDKHNMTEEQWNNRFEPFTQQSLQPPFEAKVPVSPAMQAAYAGNKSQLHVAATIEEQSGGVLIPRKSIPKSPLSPETPFGPIKPEIRPDKKVIIDGRDNVQKRKAMERAEDDLNYALTHTKGEFLQREGAKAQKYADEYDEVKGLDAKNPAKVDEFYRNKIRTLDDTASARAAEITKDNVNHKNEPEWQALDAAHKAAQRQVTNVTARAGRGNATEEEVAAARTARDNAKDAKNRKAVELTRNNVDPQGDPEYDTAVADRDAYIKRHTTVTEGRQATTNIGDPVKNPGLRTQLERIQTANDKKTAAGKELDSADRRAFQEVKKQLDTAEKEHKVLEKTYNDLKDSINERAAAGIRVPRVDSDAALRARDAVNESKRKIEGGLKEQFDRAVRSNEDKIKSGGTLTKADQNNYQAAERDLKQAQSAEGQGKRFAEDLPGLAKHRADVTAKHVARLEDTPYDDIVSDLSDSVTRKRKAFDRTFTQYGFPPGAGEAARVDMLPDRPGRRDNEMALLHTDSRVYIQMEGSHLKGSSMMNEIDKSGEGSAVVAIPAVGLGHKFTGVDPRVGSEVGWVANEILKRNGNSREAVLTPDSDGILNPQVMREARTIEAVLRARGVTDTKVAAPPVHRDKDGNVVGLYKAKVPGSEVIEELKGSDDFAGMAKHSIESGNIPKYPGKGTLDEYEYQDRNPRGGPIDVSKEWKAVNGYATTSLDKANTLMAGISHVVGPKASELPEHTKDGGIKYKDRNDKDQVHTGAVGSIGTDVLSEITGQIPSQTRYTRSRLVDAGVLKTYNLWTQDKDPVTEKATGPWRWNEKSDTNPNGIDSDTVDRLLVATGRTYTDSDGNLRPKRPRDPNNVREEDDWVSLTKTIYEIPNESHISVDSPPKKLNKPGVRHALTAESARYFSELYGITIQPGDEIPTGLTASVRPMPLWMRRLEEMNRG